MADSTIKLIIDTLIRGSGLDKLGNGLEDVVQQSKYADVALGDMKKNVKALEKQLDGLAQSDKDFARIVDEIEELNREIKQATSSARKLDDELDSAGGGIGAFDVALGGLLSGGISTAAGLFQDAGAAALDWTKTALDAGSGAAETASLLDTVLGPALGDYESRINAISDATGASVNSLKEGTKIFAVLAESAGFAQEEAAKLAAQTGETALDLNSFFDKDNALEAIGQAYKGESDGLAQFGIDVREAALQDVALRQGLVETGEALDKQSRILAVNAAIQEQAAKAMGDATKTADGYANTQRALNAEFEDFTARSGAKFVEAFAPIQEKMLETAREVIPELDIAINGLLDSFDRASSEEAGIGSTVSFENTVKGFAVLTGGYEVETKKLIQANIDNSESVEDLISTYDQLTKTRGLGVIDATGGGLLRKESSEAAVKQLALLSKNTDEFQLALQRLYAASAEAGTLNQFNPYETTGRDIAAYREELIAAEADLIRFNQAQERGASGGRGGRGSFIDPEPVRDFVTELQNPLDAFDAINAKASEVSDITGTMFADFDGEALTDSFGGASLDSLNSLGESIDSVTQKVVTLRDRSIEFSSNDYFNTTVDETGLFGEVAQNLDGASIPLVVELLLEDGTPIDDVRSTARELIEDQIGSGLAESFNQGEISETELVNTISTLKTELEAVEDPLVLLQDEAGVLYDAINDLSQDFQSSVTFSLDGLDELREARSIVEFLAGQDLSALDADFEAFVPQAQAPANSVASVAARRR